MSIPPHEYIEQILRPEQRVRHCSAGQAARAIEPFL